MFMDIESRIKTIEERNSRVEAEKAWETSAFRIVLVMLMTYIVACAALFAIRNSNPFLNALIPTLGYYLSTQSIPVIKKWWIAKHCK